MIILAIDPGTTKSGFVLVDDRKVMRAASDVPNPDLLALVQSMSNKAVDILAIEMIQSFGMSVGREVFETCVWVGRFQQAWRAPDDVMLLYRKQVVMHLCQVPKANDGNVRQAVIDMYPATGGGATPQIGTKRFPGPLYGVSSHAFQALGLAITARAVLDSSSVFEEPLPAAPPPPVLETMF